MWMIWYRYVQDVTRPLTPEDLKMKSPWRTRRKLLQSWIDRNNKEVLGRNQEEEKWRMKRLREMEINRLIFSITFGYFPNKNKFFTFALI